MYVLAPSIGMNAFFCSVLSCQDHDTVPLSWNIFTFLGAMWSKTGVVEWLDGSKYSSFLSLALYDFGPSQYRCPPLLDALNEMLVEKLF